MTIEAIKQVADAEFSRKRLVAFSVPAVIFAYLVYIFFAFDVMGLSERARLDNAATLVADTYSHKTHLTQFSREPGTFVIAKEGEKKGLYPAGKSPDWVDIDGEVAVIRLHDDQVVTINGNTARFDIPGYGTIEVLAERRGITTRLPPGEVPAFVSATKSRVDIRASGGRLTATRSKIEVHRYAFGWELFWFTLDSPFHGLGLGELMRLAMSPDRLVEGKSNASAMWGDFWYNPMWQHASVAWAIFETILMAFLGTFGAAFVALPLAFLSAKNFTPNWLARFSMRRVFDFLRGVDGLIWTIILARAFGPGPLTGSLAIMLTDTGTFGKLFSEALENVDKKQIEGVRSTGANPIQRNRFGVIPQITPVFVSQVLYYLESNTRSATVIGAIVGGGIGLNLTQAIITGKDWEEVTYYIVLIVAMVFMMDMASGWLRKKLIGTKAH